jgi:hypothetical protein
MLTNTHHSQQSVILGSTHWPGSASRQPPACSFGSRCGEVAKIQIFQESDPLVVITIFGLFSVMSSGKPVRQSLISDFIGVRLKPGFCVDVVHDEIIPQVNSLWAWQGVVVPFRRAATKKKEGEEGLCQMTFVGFQIAQSKLGSNANRMRIQAK